jgi:hypothetical protein
MAELFCRTGRKIFPRADNTVYLEESVCVAEGVAGLGFHSSVPQLLHSTRTAALDRVWGSIPWSFNASVLKEVSIEWGKTSVGFPSGNILQEAHAYIVAFLFASIQPVLQSWNVYPGVRNLNKRGGKYLFAYLFLWPQISQKNKIFEPIEKEL